MNTESRRVVETREQLPQGVAERRVETVDYASPAAGQGQQVRSVEVIHQVKVNPNSSGGVLANAAAAVESTLQSAKNALSQK